MSRTLLRTPDAPWSPTHVVPPGGLPTWDRPDGSVAPVTNAAEGLTVRVVETADAWSRVVFENGWSAWVDGRRLGALARSTAAPPPAPPAPPPPPQDELTKTMRAAVESCRKLLNDFEQKRIDADALRSGMLDAAVIRLPDCILLLDLDNGRWARFDGIRLDVTDMDGH